MSVDKKIGRNRAGTFGRTTGVILRKLRKCSKGSVLKVREESQKTI